VQFDQAPNQRESYAKTALGVAECLSACTKRSKIKDKSSGLMPTPVSATFVIPL
jgi:hypothetical protein